MLVRYSVLIVLIVLVCYGLLEARPLLVGPTLSIDSPAQGATVAGGLTTISGSAERAVLLTLDGAPLYADQSGHFSTLLAFPTGTSILTFTAADRFGRTISKTRTIRVP